MIQSRKTAAAGPRQRGWESPVMKRPGSRVRYLIGEGGSAEGCWKGDGMNLKKEFWAILGLLSSSAHLRLN